ncbi:GPI mannosyltransferase 3 [Halyomorpha halys]|uniref:GPI mannosyltransferase 3 n=1 Tax=Halyomorpha halys TaxID=286706 RepID=UPI0006D4E4DD|nr:GPI mannosyltransferase 3 [Halyomorpha halys]
MVRFKRLQTLIRYGEFPGRLFMLMLIIRCVDLLWVQSYFVPDEYYQSLEVAHKKVFGNGYLTWEWNKGIRNYFYVSLIQGIYEILKILGLDSAELIIIAPRILQGVISSLSDVYFVRWVYEKRSGQFSWGLLSWLTCYFLSFCSTRTLINTFEMNLTTIALYYYPWTPKSTSIVFTSLLSLLCYIRPTAIILWIPLVMINIFNSKKPFHIVATRYIPVAFVVGILNVAIDSYYYGSLTFTPFNFFKINVLENIGSFYGTHNLFWYWYIGLPVVIGLQIIPLYLTVLLKIFNLSHFIRSLKYDVESQMILTIIWTVTVLSFIPHKEFRFLLPLLPMAMFVSSAALGRWSINAKTWLLYAVGALLITGSSGALLFLGRFHNVGPLETMSSLRNDIGNTTSAKILFLAPCHSFPLYSHLHSKVSARFLTCNPSIGNETTIDEAEKFYQNPQHWLRSQFATLQPCTLPTHIIKYDSLNITNFLHFNNYTLSEQIFNAFFYPERTGEFVHIYKRKGKVC